MANRAEISHFDSMRKEIEYLRCKLNSLAPPSFHENSDLSKVVKKQEAVLNTLRGEFAMRMSEVEQHLKHYTIRIFGLKEEPEEDTLSFVLWYFKNKLKASVEESDIDCCYRVGSTERSQNRPLVVAFTNEPALNRVWKNRVKVKDSVYIVEELCYERNKVRQTAVKAFGQDRVSVVRGVVRVRMNDGNEMKFYTMPQICDFLDCEDCEEQASKEDSQEFSGHKSKKE